MASLKSFASYFIFRLFRLAEIIEQKNMAKSIFLAVRFEVKICSRAMIESNQESYGLHLYVEATPGESYVCISSFAVLIKWAGMALWKAHIFASKKKLWCGKIKWYRTVFIFAQWLWYIHWPLSHSSKPWSYGVCSHCRDPKTQKKSVSD
jgi:hypothetical protein